MATNPYIEIIKQIEQKAQLDEQRANTAADQGNQQAYINYMTAKKDLGDTLASQGITGGGSESAALGANVGYQRQQNVVAGNRASEVSAIRQNALANKTSTQSQSAQWQNDQQQLAEQRFANTITGYDTISKVDNAVDAAKESGETWKVPYLMAQRAALLEQAKADEAAAAAKASTSRTVSEPDPVNTNAGYQAISSTKGITSGGLSGTQGGMTSVYYPTRPLTSYSAPTTQKNPYYR